MIQMRSFIKLICLVTVEASEVVPWTFEYKAKWTRDTSAYKGDVGGYSVVISEASAGFFDRGAKIYLK